MTDVGNVVYIVDRSSDICVFMTRAGFGRR